MTQDTHEVVRKAHYRAVDDASEADIGNRLKAFEVGDTITPTESELEAFGDRFRELRNAPEESEDTEEPPLDLDDMTVAEVEEALETGDYDDSLDTIEEYESENADRNGVHNAIADRRG